MSELPKKGFLDSEEQYLFEEIRFIQKIMTDAETSYGKWEGWFVASQGILLAVIGNSLSNELEPKFIILFSIVGLILCLQFFTIQMGNRIYATSRYNRWKELEEIICKKFSNKKGEFLQVLKAQEEHKKKHRWYGRLTSTWIMRTLTPLLFGITWIIILLNQFM